MPRCTLTGLSHAASVSCRVGEPDDYRPVGRPCPPLRAARPVQPQLITGGGDLRRRIDQRPDLLPSCRHLSTLVTTERPSTARGRPGRALVCERCFTSSLSIRSDWSLPPRAPVPHMAAGCRRHPLRLMSAMDVSEAAPEAGRPPKARLSGRPSPLDPTSSTAP